MSLGGNRRGRARTYLNLLATMVLGGLWHGAAWTFVAWGAYHGALLAIRRALSERAAACAGGGARSRSPARALLARIATFHLVCVGWLLFRAPSFAELGYLLRGLRHLDVIWTRHTTEALAFVAVGFALHLGPLAEPARSAFTRLPAAAQGVAYAAAAIAAFLFSPGSERFIYFQF